MLLARSTFYVYEHLQLMELVDFGLNRRRGGNVALDDGSHRSVETY